ncbi:hypothetical protein [Candidatus Magnetominusculus xianensis]|uniref:Uncharacterized protein n=1 Tax=Candidatus Magnetominusculus xianensis TaxID=1748249 RepID=A0ABR5SEW1_9BACT|nr:hypothetical protein [Candidatus Magnetominusculus xianensis]KWT75957.1 hypothetical protein ASN18_3198 [Candidatus Magnetominusculus xianensis]MBF0405048.1 hypothetical protein [Nitrospirota bacterium]
MGDTIKERVIGLRITQEEYSRLRGLAAGRYLSLKYVGWGSFTQVPIR